MSIESISSLIATTPPYVHSLLEGAQKLWHRNHAESNTQQNLLLSGIALSCLAGATSFFKIKALKPSFFALCGSIYFVCYENQETLSSLIEDLRGRLAIAELTISDRENLLIALSESRAREEAYESTLQRIQDIFEGGTLSDVSNALVELKKITAGNHGDVKERLDEMRTCLQTQQPLLERIDSAVARIEKGLAKKG
jgi:hypothetical protein